MRNFNQSKHQGGKNMSILSKSTVVALTLACLSGVGLANDKADDYRKSANIQIAKIMRSEKTFNEKIAILNEKAVRLSCKRNLNVKQRVELREIYSSMAKSYYSVVKDFKSAAEYFDKAIAIEDSGVLELYKANSLIYDKRYAEAIEAYRRAILFGDLPKENMPNVFFMLGYGEYYLGDYGAAENDLKKAILMNNKQKGLAERLVVTCLQKLGKHDEALACLDRMNIEGRNVDFALRTKAKILCEIGSYDDCARVIEQLEEKYPLDEALYLLKAQLSFAKGDFENVTRQIDIEFSKPGRKSTYDYDCYIMRAQIALQDKQYQEALDFVNKAVREPMPPYSTKLRGDIYLAMGDKYKALECYKEFLRISPSATLNKYVAGVVADIEIGLKE